MRRGHLLVGGSAALLVIVGGCGDAGRVASLGTDEPAVVRSAPTPEERLCAGKAEGRYEVREAGGWVTEYGCRGGRFHGEYMVSQEGTVWVRGMYVDGAKVGLWEMRDVDGKVYTRRYINDVPVY